MDRLRHAVESCVLAPGDQLPGIRTLAQQLVISPNTVVKAYTELDREGVIELRHGIGAFVVDQERHRDRGKEVRMAKNLVRDFVEKLRKRGFTNDEIRRFLEAELTVAAEEVRNGN
jgi:GntR family transcriptional regulator